MFQCRCRVQSELLKKHFFIFVELICIFFFVTWYFFSHVRKKSCSSSAHFLLQNSWRSEKRHVLVTRLCILSSSQRERKELFRESRFFSRDKKCLLQNNKLIIRDDSFHLIKLKVFALCIIFMPFYAHRLRDAAAFVKKW